MEFSSLKYLIGLLLPLRLHPTLVVLHLDLSVRHLPNAQHLEHQDSKRPDIAPETQWDLFLTLYLTIRGAPVRFKLVSKLTDW